jgi:quinoprotein glucose dehydrogenase
MEAVIAPCIYAIDRAGRNLPLYHRGMKYLLALLLCASSLPAQDTTEWRHYGRDAGGARYSPLRQINRQNVNSLKQAWTFHTGEVPQGRSRSFEATPLKVEGRLYLSTPLGQILALDPATGHLLWKYDAHVNPQTNFGDFASRGVSYWTSNAGARGKQPCEKRIIAASVDARLIALDAASGQPCDGFGVNGVVNLRTGLRNNPLQNSEYEVTSPPAIVAGLIITGSAVADNNRIDAASGEVRAFDVRTGELKWIWDPVPQDSVDPAFTSWRGAHARRTGGANTWSVIAVDSARGLVFVPTSSPSPDYYGGERAGDNRYANSVVAIQAATGKVIWHFQTVHHDLWDYDNAAPPALLTITRNGKRIPVVVQATKSGQIYVLHRETGIPVFPVAERAVPQSDVPGEFTSATQPFSSVDAISPQRFDLSSLASVDSLSRAFCTSRLSGLRNEGVFTPISLRGSIMYPSNIGGAHWGGLAYDVANETVIVAVNTAVAIAQLIPEATFNPDSARADGRRTGAQFTRMRGTPYWMRREIVRSPTGLCTAMPLGKLVAVSMKTGKKLWEAALPTPNLGGPIATAGGLVFLAGTADKRFRAFDSASGKELWSAELPAGGKATPMTYLHEGRQYVLISAGGDGEFFGGADAVIAYTVPVPRKK